MILKDSNKIYCVYRIRNVITSKCYIGQTTDFRSRVRDHTRELNRNIHRCKHLQLAWNQSRSDNFKFEILEILETEGLEKDDIKNLLKILEEKYMLKYQAGNHDYCYNSFTPIKSSYGAKFKIETANSKACLQYDLDGNFIREWPCIRNVTRELGLSDSSISACCGSRFRYKGKWKYRKVGQFMWRYKTENYPLKIKAYTTIYEDLYNVPVLKYNKYGEFIEKVESISLASASHKQEILDCCRTKRATTLGFIWRFKTEGYLLQIQGTLKRKVPQPRKRNRKSRYVDQYDIQGNFIKRWDSLSDIQKELGFQLNDYSILYADYAHGYKWKFA